MYHDGISVERDYAEALKWYTKAAWSGYESSLESDDWKPTQKVLDFERKHGIQRPGATNKE